MYALKTCWRCGKQFPAKQSHNKNFCCNNHYKEYLFMNLCRFCGTDMWSRQKICYTCRSKHKKRGGQVSRRRSAYYKRLEIKKQEKKIKIIV